MTQPPKPAKAGPRKPDAPTASDQPEGERIAKVLSRAGIASRREAERMIALGQVTVNGRTIDSPALNVAPADRITVAGQPVGAPDTARLWLYYKPEGLVTSAADEKGRETVFDRLPPELPRVMSIGRLDLNSEGLLLLTNDGGLKRRLELPSTGWLRKYRVRIKGNPTDPDLDPLRRGITVEGERFQPMTVTLDRVQGANAWLTVGLREGKNREIRRAMTAIGLTVNRLIRVSYGPFRLGEMQPGEVSEVRGKVLRDQLGETDAEADMTGTARAKPRPKTGPAVAKTDASTRTRRAGPALKTDTASAPRTGRKPAGGPAPSGLSAPPRTAKPGTAKPGTAKPGTAKPGTAKTKVPGRARSVPPEGQGDGQGERPRTVPRTTGPKRPPRRS